MVSRRNILIGGGAGLGLIVAWAAWPRRYAANLVLNPGEHGFGACLKIGSDGHVTVAVPQAEHGQGAWTVLPQIVADELGADWRTIGVEPAPLNPLYANPLALADLLERAAMPAPLREAWARRAAVQLTGGSTSVRMFEAPCRAAGAAARALLAQAAAARWGVAADACTARDGFIVHGDKRLRFADLAEEASRGTAPDPLPIGVAGAGRLTGRSVPRLDAPAKVDGSANYAGDVRLPDMVHAAVRAAPAGARLLRVDRAAADRVAGVVSVVTGDGWVAAVATTGWAAQRALDAMAPTFEMQAGTNDASIDAALTAALVADGVRMAGSGEMATTGREITAGYDVAAGVHGAIETPAATAAYRNGRLELWLATQAPVAARAAAARAAGLAVEAVVLHPMPIGGSFGAALEHDAAEQAAVLAVKLARPVCLIWSRGEACRHDRVRPPARARMAARLSADGAIVSWQARIAAPATGAALARRVVPGAAAALAGVGSGDAYAVAGALPPYRIPAVAIDHHPADLGIATGHLRGGAHGASCFFTECFLDEIAHAAGQEPLSYRIGMLGDAPRLARCLSTAAALGGWEGGIPGSGQGIAAHAFRGSFVAVLAEARVEPGAGGARVVVDRLVAAVDCGRQVNPDLVRQQIEGGLIFGMAHALGAATGFADGLPRVRGFGGVALPRLADTPDLTIEMIASDEAPGGVSEIAVPPVAPAIANAVATRGFRLRALPLKPTS
jgi:isoquinoline 1-oxidoreductase beta subunit